MLKSIAISLWMAAQALAEPIPIDLPELRDIVGREIEPRILRNVSVVATFEDRVAQNGPTRTALGVYKGLNFQGLVVVKAGDGVNGDITTGLVPYSKTNSIAYGIMPLNGIRPEITTNYTNSKAVSFELNSFWYGCVVGKVTDIVSAPADCKISVKGYDRSGKRVGFQQFTYTPFNSDMVTEMQQARLDIHFVGLARVIFSTTYESVRHLGVTLFDNMEYIVTAKI